VLRKKFGKKFMSHVMHCEYKRPLQVRQEISIIIRRMKNIVSIFLNEVSGVFLIKRISAGSADQCTPEFGGKRKAGCRQVVVSRDQYTAIHGHAFPFFYFILNNGKISGNPAIILQGECLVVKLYLHPFIINLNSLNRYLQ